MPASMEVGLRQSTLPLGPMQPRRLLDIIERLPAVETGNPLRWLEGITWEPWPCREMRTNSEVDCDSYEFNDNAVSECEEWVTQTPFQIFEAMKRSTLDFTSLLIGDRLEARYNRQISSIFADELLGGWNGVGLRDVAGEPDGHPLNSAAVSVRDAMQLLENQIAKNRDGEVGYIHSAPGMLGSIVMECGLYLVDGHWETPAGNWVISDAGYEDPPEPVGGGAPSAGDGEDWLYASGPVFYESTAPTLLGPAFTNASGGGSETLATPWSRDTLIGWIMGYGILAFDPCPVVAVLAEYPT